MYALPLPRKWKFTKIIEINTKSSQIAVDESGELPIYIPTEEGVYRSFRGDEDNGMLVVNKGERVVFRNVISNGYLVKAFVKEIVSDEEFKNSDLLLSRFNGELENSFGVDDIELSRMYQSAFDELIKKALANCQHLKLDEGFEIGLKEGNNLSNDQNNSLSTIVGANSANGKIHNEGIKNNIFGIENLWQAINASHNCAFGFHSQWRATTAYANCSFGNETLDNNQDGEFNCAFGPWTMKSELHNNWKIPVCLKRNNAFGAFALYRTRSEDNNAFGFESLCNNEIGKNNLAVGNYSGKHASGDNEFYLDNLDRENSELEKVYSLLFGVFDKDVNKQKLSLNAGLIRMPHLPHEDPHENGALWIDDCVLKISKG